MIALADLTRHALLCQNLRSFREIPGKGLRNRCVPADVDGAEILRT